MKYYIAYQVSTEDIETPKFPDVAAEGSMHEYILQLEHIEYENLGVCIITTSMLRVHAPFR